MAFQPVFGQLDHRAAERFGSTVVGLDIRRVTALTERDSSRS
jgi:hypothetical protein